MNTTVLMSVSQQSGSDLWRLAPGQAMSLPVGPGDRYLSVVEGRMWLTFDGREDEPADDIWLESGQTVQLHDGQVLVAEACPSASFRLSVPPCKERSNVFSRLLSGFGARASQ